MINVLRLAVALAVTALLASATTAADSTTIAAQLAAKFASVQSWQGRFEQTLIDINGRQQQRVEGEFALQQPNLIDWRYAAPLNQRLVSDGERIWFYDSDLEQVTVQPLAALLRQSPAAILLGQLPPSPDYQVRVEQLSAASGETVLRYTLDSQESGSGSAVAQLVLDWQGEQLSAMTSRDNFGQTTVVVFSEVVRDRAIDPHRFMFTPPAGVDVVH